MAIRKSTPQAIYGPGTTGCDCLRPGGCAACHDFYDQLKDEDAGEGPTITDTSRTPSKPT